MSQPQALLVAMATTGGAEIALVSSPASAVEEASPSDETEACFTAAERAQPLMKQKRLREARAQLETCARDVCPPVARTDCRNWLAEVLIEQPSIVIAAHEVRGAEVHDVHGVRMVVDGAIAVENADATPVTLDPGRHQLRLERAGAEPLDQDVDLKEGDKGRTVHAYWQAPQPIIVPPPQPAPVALYATGALGVAALGLGASLEIAGLIHRNALVSSCRPTRSCSQSDVDGARNTILAGDLVLGSGVLLAGAAAFLYFNRPAAGRPPQSNRSSWAIEPARGGLAAVFAHRF